MQLHTGYFGTLDNESAYSVDTVPTGMVVTDTVQFYLPDDGKMFTNGIVITDILIVGQDVIEDYGEVDDSGYVSILTKVNGKALFRDITLTASDVNALPSSTVVPTIIFKDWRV